MVDIAPDVKFVFDLNTLNILGLPCLLQRVDHLEILLVKLIDMISIKLIVDLCHLLVSHYRLQPIHRVW